MPAAVAMGCQPPFHLPPAPSAFPPRKNSHLLVTPIGFEFFWIQALLHCSLEVVAQAQHSCAMQGTPFSVSESIASEGRGQHVAPIPPVPSSPVFECKYCRRTSEAENPIEHQRHQKPRLCWRRFGGRECAHCPYMIMGDPDLAPRRATLEKDLVDPEKGEELFAVYMQKLHAWEAKKNERPNSRQRASFPTVEP